MGYKYHITVFTPTYNRAYIIENLYRSLKRQTYTDFEWLVVDDGSTDNTEELFNAWKSEENPISIRYYKQPNGGKCRAINKALDLADGELFFTVDSDDYLTDDALEKVKLWFESIPENSRIKGIVANRGYSSSKTLNYCFDDEYLDKSLLDMYSFPKCKNTVGNGERAFVFYTDFHRQYKYPEFEGENFMTEAVAWNRMANDGYKMRFYNDIIWIYKYKEDGLTLAGSKVFLDNPQGYGLCLAEKAKFLNYSVIQKYKMYYTFTCDLYSRYSSEKISKYIGAPKFFICLIFFIRKCLGRIKND